MLKKWTRHIGQYKRDTIATPLCVALEVVTEILIPLLMADMIDRGITGGSMGMLAKYGLALV
ncbi:ABC transporter ATP-binding protein, partial [Clostridia bacterium OttesenSCG-928-O13]|nr:ABC transporter ATP-binding protein [Clostridia bacterium OttesenSCG-928-O13]